MTERVGDIETAFYRVKSSVERFMGGDEASKERSFEEIFALNNEIGRLAHERPKTMPKMKELQAYVNMITVGIKSGRMGDLREGLSATEESIRAMKKEFAQTP